MIFFSGTVSIYMFMYSRLYYQIYILFHCFENSTSTNYFDYFHNYNTPHVSIKVFEI